jgi:protein-tyrosine kinase
MGRKSWRPWRRARPRERDDRTRVVGAHADIEIREEMLLLHQSINVRLPNVRRRVIHFTAAQHGEGTSTIVRAYALALSGTLGQSVLIVDANEDSAAQHAFLGVQSPDGWGDALARDGVGSTIYRTAYPNLSVTPFARRESSNVPSVFDEGALTSVFAELRDRFETVLVDSSPVLRPGALAVSSGADGVVLVLEADRTRWPVVARANASIERRGGNVLGIVLNKRRYYIPDAIYRWL